MVNELLAISSSSNKAFAWRDFSWLLLHSSPVGQGGEGRRDCGVWPPKVRRLVDLHRLALLRGVRWPYKVIFGMLPWWEVAGEGAVDGGPFNKRVVVVVFPMCAPAMVLLLLGYRGGEGEEKAKMVPCT
jgi:hypothetical protein